PDGSHGQLEVHLCGHPHGRSGHDLMIVRAAAMAANSATPSDSPLAAGSTPASRRIRSAWVTEPAHDARAERSIFLRCANAASITSKSSRLLTCGPGGWCRVKATRAESTRGTGQNTLRGTGPARRSRAYQASFTVGTP